MTTIFCVRPATPNIGNSVINRATMQAMFEAFGSDLSIVNVPAIAEGGRGGLTAAQVYDINRLADGVILGGGNLFENGQITVEAQALEALRAPLMLMGLSHGRIYDEAGGWIARSDSMPADMICRLVRKAEVAMVRDRSCQMSRTSWTMGKCSSRFATPRE